ALEQDRRVELAESRVDARAPHLVDHNESDVLPDRVARVGHQLEAERHALAVDHLVADAVAVGVPPAGSVEEPASLGRIEPVALDLRVVLRAESVDRRVDLLGEAEEDLVDDAVAIDEVRERLATGLLR